MAYYCKGNRNFKIHEYWLLILQLFSTICALSIDLLPSQLCKILIHNSLETRTIFQRLLDRHMIAALINKWFRFLLQIVKNDDFILYWYWYPNPHPRFGDIYLRIAFQTIWDTSWYLRWLPPVLWSQKTHVNFYQSLNFCVILRKL